MNLYCVRIEYRFNSAFIKLSNKYYSRVVEASSVQNAIEIAIETFYSKYRRESNTIVDTKVFKEISKEP